MRGALQRALSAFFTKSSDVIALAVCATVPREPNAPSSGLWPPSPPQKAWGRRRSKLAISKLHFSHSFFSHAPFSHLSATPLHRRRRMRGALRRALSALFAKSSDVIALAVCATLPRQPSAPSSGLRPPSPPQKAWGRRRSKLAIPKLHFSHSRFSHSPFSHLSATPLNRAPSPPVLFGGRRCRRRMRGALQSALSALFAKISDAIARVVCATLPRQASAPSSGLRPPSPPQKAWGRRRSNLTISKLHFSRFLATPWRRAHRRQFTTSVRNAG